MSPVAFKDNTTFDEDKLKRLIYAMRFIMKS